MHKIFFKHYLLKVVYLWPSWLMAAAGRILQERKVMSLSLFQSRAARFAARRDMTPAQLRFENDSALKTWTNIGLGLAVVIGIAVVGSHGGNISTGIAAFGAALGLGGILGFLFGVPSVANTPVNINNAASVAVGTGNDSSTIGGAVDGADKQTETLPVNGGGTQIDLGNALLAGPPNPRASPLIAPPTTAVPSTAKAPPSTSGALSQPDAVPSNPGVSNLEQVADWVTKLLLGGGLTQLGRIPPKIWQWSRMVALGIIGDSKNINEQMIVSQQSFAAGLLVYGFVLGFFGGFLITKLQLGKAISG